MTATHKCHTNVIKRVAERIPCRNVAVSVVCSCSGFVTSSWLCVQPVSACIFTYSVCMALNEEKVPLAMVWSLLSYSESRLRLWRSWNASTRRHAILLAFNSLENKQKGQAEDRLLAFISESSKCYRSPMMALMTKFRYAIFSWILTRV